MNGNKLKEGVSVREIEEFAKKHRFEVFFALLFGFACIFSLIGYFSAGWSVLLMTGGGILSVLMPQKMEELLKTAFSFVFKQDKTVQIVMAVVSLIFAVFIPFLVFFLLGVAGGRKLHQHLQNPSA